MILTLDIGNSTMKIIAYTHQDDVIFERSSKTYKEPDELFYQEFFQDLKRLCFLQYVQVSQFFLVSQCRDIQTNRSPLTV